jgi:hypothetical protein
MSDGKTESGTVCDKIVRTFLDQLAAVTGFEEIAGKLEDAILDNKPSENSIRTALFDEDVS